MTGVRTWLILGILSLATIAATGVGVRYALSQYHLVPGIRGCNMLADRSDRISCLEKEYRASYDPARLNAWLHAVQRQSVDTSSECHFALHGVARWAVRRTRDLDALMLAANRTDPHLCAGGFIHGVSQEAFSSGRVRLSTHVQLCREQAGISKRYVCAHALGHGLARTRGIDETRSGCNLLLEDAQLLRNSCMMGQYMERMVTKPTPEEPGRMCRGVPLADQYSCGTAIPELLEFAGQLPETPGLFKICRSETKTQAAQIGCGEHAALWMDRSAPGRLCESFTSPAAAASCAFGYAQGDVQETGKVPRGVREACARPRLAWGCSAGIGRGALFAGKTAEMCDQAPVPHACHAGHALCYPVTPGIAVTPRCDRFRLPKNLQINA